MTYEEALLQLEDLLRDERRALLDIRLDDVVALGGRKAALLRVVEDGLEPGARAGAELVDLARRVREAADRNWFLIRHLRGCLVAVGGERSALPTYGRNGLASAPPAAGATRARL